MAYRTKLAQEAHSAILQYIRGHKGKQDKNRIINAINALTKHSMLELSKNGDSHLIDILHLSHEIPNQNPIETCKYLLNLLLTKAHRIGNDTLIRLLIYPNEAGFTPLHEALIAGNPQNLRVYIDEVRRVFKNGLLTKDQFVELLTGANQAGFTPLHSVLKTGHPKNMRVYFDEVRKVFNDKLLTKNQLVELLTGANKAGYTPLHQAAYSGSFKIVSDFIGILKEMLSADEYNKSLWATTKKGGLSSSMQGKHDSIKINKRLDDERKHNPRTLTGHKRRTPDRHYAHGNSENRHSSDQHFSSRHASRHRLYAGHESRRHDLINSSRHKKQKHSNYDDNSQVRANSSHCSSANDRAVSARSAAVGFFLNRGRGEAVRGSAANVPIVSIGFQFKNKKGS